MAHKPPHPCNKPMCGNLTKKRYCDDCERAERRKYDEDRKNDPYRDFYMSAEWRWLRDSKLRKDPVCQCKASCCPDGCRQGATVVDHIIPIRKGGAKLKWRNLQSLAENCHNRKTAKEGRFDRKFMARRTV